MAPRHRKSEWVPDENVQGKIKLKQGGWRWFIVIAVRFILVLGCLSRDESSEQQMDEGKHDCDGALPPRHAWVGGLVGEPFGLESILLATGVA